jgi:hypothetical protein
MKISFWYNPEGKNNATYNLKYIDIGLLMGELQAAYDNYHDYGISMDKLQINYG